MRRTDYEALAATYDRRYETEDWTQTVQAIEAFVGGAPREVLEVGCGTGHWLARLAEAGHAVRGLDASEAMLARARARLPDADLRHGSAERLPWPDATFDRVMCVHAIHHFPKQPAFVREARRVLRPGGAALALTLDPHSPDMAWAVYDYWPQTRALDLERYPSAERIRRMMAEASLVNTRARLVQRITGEHDAQDALAAGRLDVSVTSQLAILTAEEYASGRRRLRDAIASAAEAGEALRLRTSLELWAVTGVVPGRTSRRAAVSGS